MLCLENSTVVVTFYALYGTCKIKLSYHTEQRKSKCFIFELSPKPQLHSFIKPFAIFRLHRYREKNYRILGSGLETFSKHKVSVS